MVSHQPDFAPTLTSTPREFPSAVKNGALLLMAVGAAAFAFGLFTQADRTLATFVINFMYWAGICQGALIFAAALVLVKGRWGRPLKRLAEAFSLVMVPLYLMLIVFMVAGGLDIYEWMHWTAAEAPPHKAIYLTQGFFIARQVVGLGVLIALNLLFVRTSLRSDVGALTESGGYKLEGPLAMLAGIDNWQGTASEAEASTARQAKIAPAIVICYSIVFSVLAVDMSMSLAPHWYANMFPAWFFMSCFWSGLVWLGLYSLFARKWMGTEKIMDASMYHDLGKLTFGFTMFWGYTTFAHYLPIWYGNMTEEIGFILIRTELEPWAGVTKVMLVVCFLVPWGMLLSRGLKKIPAAYTVVASVLAVGIWLERYVVIMPSVWKHDTVPLGLIEIGTTLGFLGLFLFVVTYTLSKVPAVCHTDPYMQPDPDHIHVLPKSQAHHH